MENGSGRVSVLNHVLVTVSTAHVSKTPDIVKMAARVTESMAGDVIHRVTKTVMSVLAKEKTDIVIKVVLFF
jgi:phenylpyruvate tautomerase PptA (4-oxalocrotonate tautomerase family)